MTELFHNAIPSLPDLRIVARIMARQPYPFPKKDFRGAGYLAGEFPSGVTSVDGTPVSAEVRVLWRDPAGSDSDGCLVKTVQSAPDGTWYIDGIDVNLKYDVVGRKEGYNDVIVSNVTPTSMVEITYTGEVLPNDTFTGALGYLELVGGIPPYAASVVDPLPVGIFPVVNGRQLIIDGTTTDDDVFSSTVRITSSNGATRDVPVNLVVGFKAPANFKAKTLEDAGAFSVLLTWEVTNTTQEVLVFRSATPFDLESLPAPIATLTGDAVSYTDDDVIEDDVFYYMAASVCESFTLYSDGVREVVILGDPHWDKVVALVHFDTDYSDSAGTVWTPAPNTIISATAKFGGGAMYSDGYAGISADGEQFNFGTDDYTIEGYWKADAFNRSFFAWDGGRRVLYCYNAGYAYWNGSVNAIVGATVNTTDFVHIAFTRASGVARLFIDGVLVGTYIDDSFATTSNSVKTGNFGFQNLSGGYTDELRITKGVARYTESFTPPTEPFLDK